MNCNSLMLTVITLALMIHNYTYPTASTEGIWGMVSFTLPILWQVIFKLMPTMYNLNSFKHYNIPEIINFVLLKFMYRTYISNIKKTIYIP